MRVLKNVILWRSVLGLFSLAALLGVVAVVYDWSQLNKRFVIEEGANRENGKNRTLRFSGQP